MLLAIVGATKTCMDVKCLYRLNGEKGVLKLSILFYLIFIAGKNSFALRSSPLKEIENYVYLMYISMIHDWTWLLTVVFFRKFPF